MNCYECSKCRLSNSGITCGFYPTPVLIIDPYGKCVYARVIEVEKEEDDKSNKGIVK